MFKRSLWLIVAAFLCFIPMQAQAACDWEIGESGTSNAKIITDTNEELLCIQAAIAGGGGGGGVTDGDKGDIIVSSGGTSWKLDQNTPVTSFGSGDTFPCFEGTTLKQCSYDDLPGAGGGISDIVEDTTPQLGGNLDANTFSILFDDNTGILDDLGNELLLFQRNSAAANFIEIENATATNPAIIRATGSDTNVNLRLEAKGSGSLTFEGSTIWHAGNDGSGSGLDADMVDGAGVRPLLSANRTYYVRTDGSDSNTCLTNSSGGACLTIQGAVDKAAAIDFNGFTVTIQIVDGTYTTAVVVPPMTGQTDIDDFVIQGNNSTPANVIVSTTSASAIVFNGGARGLVKDLEVRTTTSGAGIVAAAGGSIAQVSNIRCGTIVTYCLLASQNGSITAVGDFSVTASAFGVVNAQSGGVVTVSSRTITVSGSPAWSAAFFVAQTNGVIYMVSTSFSGSATGDRVDATSGGVVINTSAGTVPGNSSGTQTSPGYLGNP